MQPGLPALLRHEAVGSPGGILVVESLVGCADCLFVGIRHSRLVETRKVGQSIIGCGRHHPGIASFAEIRAKTVIVLEDQRGLRTHLSKRRVPTHRRIGEVDVELGDHRLSLQFQVCRRRKVGFFDILQIIGKSLLRRTSAAGIPFDGSLVDHDGKSESGMGLGRCHNLQRRLIQGIARSIPIEDYAIDSAAHHVVNLICDFGGIGRVVTNVHVVRLPEPQFHVGEDLCRRAGIKQSVDVNLAHISRAEVAVGQRRKCIRGACVVGSLG